MTKSAQSRVGGHEQLISNQHLPKEIGRMQEMIDLRGIPTKTSLVPPLGFFKTMGSVQYGGSFARPAEFLVAD
jgi:hypothetical protein